MVTAEELERFASIVKALDVVEEAGGDDRVRGVLHEGRLIYAIEQAGFRRGAPVHENRWCALVEPCAGTPCEEAEAVAATLARLPQDARWLVSLVERIAKPHFENPDDLKALLEKGEQR